MSGQWGHAQPGPQHHRPTPRPWYKKKRWIIPLGLLVTFAVIGQLGDDPGNQTVQPANAAGPEAGADEVATTTPTTAPRAKKPPGRAVTKNAATTSTVSAKKAKRTAPAKKVVRATKVIRPRPKKTTPKPRSTRSRSNCDANYSGACVPIADDVDCAGGSGNGPKYFRGIARITGSDIYDLDRDGDGFACEPY
jgi:hypothetical protein